MSTSPPTPPTPWSVAPIPAAPLSPTVSSKIRITMQVLRIAAKVLPFIGKRLMKGQDKIFEQIRIVNFHGLIAGLLTGLGLLLVYILMAFMVVYDLNGGVCAIAFIGLTTGMFCFAACTISLVTLYVSDNGKKKGV